MAIDTAGVGDASSDVRWPATVHGYAREVPAAFKAVTEAVFRPDPRVLWPHEPGVHDATAAAR
ncbi:hypothetical protein [Pseudonocardia aurantiaca]|uniref:Uncharacterized protein n=1 Tax=Pseudonocardia aurantiaca TaxID=75290 RepID=A0ABW4FL79_9PSEU